MGYGPVTKVVFSSLPKSDPKMEKIARYAGWLHSGNQKCVIPVNWDELIDILQKRKFSDKSDDAKRNPVTWVMVSIMT